MKWLLVNPLRALPPLGLVAVGALAGAAGTPIIKKTVRSAAVLTVKGILAIKECIHEAGGALNMNRNNHTGAGQPADAAEGAVHAPVVQHPSIREE